MKSTKNAAQNKTLRKAIAAEMAAIYQILQDVNDSFKGNTPDFQDVEDYPDMCLDYDIFEGRA